MEKIKCKECGKEVNKKAEICPNCGCRLKSNTLKIILICLTIIVVLACVFLEIKYVKNKVEDYRKLKEQKIEEQKKEEINQEETKIYESYLGNYNVSYNSELFFLEHPYYTIKQSISATKKCYRQGELYIQDGDILNDCLSFENAQTIPFIYSFDGFIIYKKDSNIIFYTVFKNLVKSSIVPDASKESMDEIKLRDYDICFSGTESELKQIDCPAEISSDDSLSTRYEFKLTKIK